MPTQMFSTTVTSPGTPQKITQSTTPGQATISGALSGNATLRGSSIIFQAAAGNTSTKFIYIGGPSMNVAAKTGIGMQLAPGVLAAAVYPEGSTSLDDFWIDTDGASTDKLFVTVTG